MIKRGLLIFAREPLPGTVKTRLAMDTGPEPAAELYAAMLRDVLAKAASLENISIWVCWATEKGTIPSCHQPHGFRMFAQQGSTLGERMQNAFEMAFSSGIGSCCIIGTDSPDLPTDYINQAFHLMEHENKDVVFGPAADGGYYLAGMKRLWSRLFDNIPWSSPAVLADSLARADELNLETALLPPWYDVDTISDLQRVCLSEPSSAPHTHEVISRIGMLCSLAGKDSPI